MHLDRFRAASVVKTMLGRLQLVAAEPPSRSRQLGQVLPLFALLSVVLLGGAALLTDVAWWWTSEQRMQRAADAAALAGADYLPRRSGRERTPRRGQKPRRTATPTGSGGVRGDRPCATFRTTPATAYRRCRAGRSRHNFARVFCWDGGPCLEQVQCRRHRAPPSTSCPCQWAAQRTTTACSG